jgi:hypothetical protein
MGWDPATLPTFYVAHAMVGWGGPATHPFKLTMVGLGGERNIPEKVQVDDQV